MVNDYDSYVATENILHVALWTGYSYMPPAWSHACAHAARHATTANLLLESDTVSTLVSYICDRA